MICSVKTLITLLFCIVQNDTLYSAPNKDSLTIVESLWEQEELFSGVTFKQIWFAQKELFDSNQSLHLIEIAPQAEVAFALAAEPLLTTTGEIAQKHDAFAAVNGSFFKFTDGENTDDYNSVVYLRINNERLANNTYSDNGQRQRHQEAAVVIVAGALSILKATVEEDWETNICGEAVICSGPLLAIDGNLEPLRQEPFYTTRHPRTVVAKKRDGTVMLFVADGRHAEAEGMSLDEVQKCLLWLEASDILNFDGGGSSTMYVQGKGDEGIVNHPSDNRQFDHLGSRRVANALYVIRL